jgi:type I restriction enzyme, S subunit
MNPYPSYKESGVEWMWKIPSGWTPTRNKFLFTITKSLVGERSRDYQLLSLTKKGIIPRDIESGKGKFPEKFDTYQVVGKDNLVFCLYDIDETPRTIGLSTYNGMITGSYTVIKFNEGVDPKFVYYNYLSIDDVKGLRPYYTGLRKVVRTHTFLGLKVQTPPLQEQQQISNYLDHKTQQIDSLIEKTQQKIELLKEQRTSLINQVVTKGLNPDVEMKDSGVEWIGEIPREWKFVKVGHYMDVVRGGSPRPSGDPRYFDGTFIPWITVKDISNPQGKFVSSTESYLTEEGMKQSRVLEEDTLVLTNSGVTLGIPKVLKIRGCINDGSIGFLNMKKEIYRDYLYYFFTTQTSLLLEQQSGYGQPNLNTGIVSNIRLPLPKSEEQQQIVEHLDKETTKIDSTIEKETQRIDLLKEYRQSLISDVVTGKVDVRDEVVV